MRQACVGTKYLSRRQLGAILVSAAGSALVGRQALYAANIPTRVPAPASVKAITPELGLSLYDEATRLVVPVRTAFRAASLCGQASSTWWRASPRPGALHRRL